MTNLNVREALRDQLSRTNRMFRQAVELCPDDEWHKGDMPYLRPAGLALHVVETIDFYAGEQAADAYPWGYRFDVDWEDADAGKLPRRDKLLAYLDDAERKLDTWLDEADLLASESTFPWTGTNGLGRMVYLLRNTQHHLAEICLELTRRGYDAPEWA